MKYEEIKRAVDRCFSAVDRVNRKVGYKRFYPFSTVKNGRLFEYGIYDYTTKKYVHFYAQTQEGEREIEELQKFIEV